MVEEMEQCKNRNDDGEYIRTAVVFDAEDEFMKQVPPFIIFRLFRQYKQMDYRYNQLATSIINHLLAIGLLFIRTYGLG